MAASKSSRLKLLQVNGFHEVEGIGWAFLTSEEARLKILELVQRRRDRGQKNETKNNDLFFKQ